MIKWIFRLGIIALLAVLAYNFFFGTASEKESAQRIISEFKDVAVAVKDLFTSEKEKLDDGKYDSILDRIGSLFERMENRAEEFDPDFLSEIKELEEKHHNLKQEWEESEKAKSEDSSNAAEDSNIRSFMNEDAVKERRFKEKVNDLVKETEAILKKMKLDQEVE